jgi:hypothetical protein
MNCFGSRLPRGGAIMAAERSQFANSPVVSTNKFSYFDPFLQSIAQSAFQPAAVRSLSPTTRL